MAVKSYCLSLYINSPYCHPALTVVVAVRRCRSLGNWTFLDVLLDIPSSAIRRCRCRCRSPLLENWTFLDVLLDIPSPAARRCRCRCRCRSLGCWKFLVVPLDIPSSAARRSPLPLSLSLPLPFIWLLEIPCCSVGCSSVHSSVASPPMHPEQKKPTDLTSRAVGWLLLILGFVVTF